MRFCFLLLLVISFYQLAAQTGNLDESFNSVDKGYGAGDGPSGEVLGSVLQPDGKLLIVGSFLGYNSKGVYGAARLNVDGTLDSSFKPSIGYSIHSVALQPDGKILMAGLTGLGGALARVLPDNTLDTSFKIGAGFYGKVQIILVQPDGKIIVGGAFTSFNNIPVGKIVRLHPDGSHDPSFNVGTGPGGTLNSIALRSDGKMYVAGNFTSFNGTTVRSIALLNSDGSVDTGFSSGSGPDNPGFILSVAIQPDGNVLLAGAFSSYNGTTRYSLARITPSGSLDPGFITVSDYQLIRYVRPLPDGRIIIAGVLQNYGGTGKNGIVRLNANGSIDQSFLTNGIGEGEVMQVEVRPNGQLLTGGRFVKYGGKNVQFLVQINTDGTPDMSFNKMSGFNDFLNSAQTTLPSSVHVRSLAVQSDAKIIVGGSFTNYNGVECSGLIRLNPDGTQDFSFTPEIWKLARIYSVIIQEDGKILVSGNIYDNLGNPLKPIIRLLPDGSPDPGFNIPSVNVSSGIEIMKLQTDGKILIYGGFTQVNGVARTRLARLHSNGTLDQSFISIIYGTNHIVDMEVLADGKILIGGPLNDFVGSPRHGIARLNTNGTLDLTFDAQLAINSAALDITISKTGKIYVSGDFYNGPVLLDRILLRFNEDGSVDPGFDTGPAPGMAHRWIYQILEQSDGRILLGGIFSKYNGITANGVVRVFANGSIDSSFNFGPNYFTTSIRSMVSYGENMVILGGTSDFTSYSGVGRNRIARINSYLLLTGTPDTTSVCAGSSIKIPYSGITLTSGNTVSVQLSDATGSFVNPATIGSLSTTNSKDTINCIIPVNSVSGTGYRVRVMSTAPAYTGSPSAPITIHSASACVTALPKITEEVKSANLYPNNIQGSTTLVISVNKSQKVLWSVIDMSGKTLRYFNQDVVAGTHNKMLLNFSSLPSGSYILEGKLRNGHRVSLKFQKM